ncbi:host specificity protein J [Serratia liquefaciens]|uniref:host specificity protein J n=1 Tax=Serratia liquefaciens TaxID=614 RepID=UPI00059DA4FE|nr:host specificity protein J [Serratia liquefaciens]
MENVMIKGRKGGASNTTTPTESPDSLQSTSYAKILLALGEGEWEGGLDGTNIFLDGTPIVAADGTQNFPGVRWEFRPGTPDQEYIQGMPDVENEITVGTELTGQTPWVRSLTNTQLSAFRLRFSWQQLQQQLDNGDVVGYRIEYAIDVATDGGAYQQMYPTAIDGKTTTKYERSHRIDLPVATTGWQVRVRRLTPNSTSNRIADKMVIESITELIDVKLRYPETALLFVQFDAKQFQNIPAVSCEPKMGIVRVPTTYDPITRSYTGTWDGSFKWAWTNNPAWVFYDLLVNDRYSIGERIKAENLVMTKFDLYAIAQYCDQLVPDGRGGDGQEPRFLCDAYIQSQEEAWTVLRDFANIFRGMTYWAKNSMNALADMPRDLDYTYTRANVKDGEFRDSSASEKTHYSMAMVSWADPANGYQDAVAPVFENSLIRRYNIKQAEITAIGCTRETEAIRRGRWLLLTNDKDRVINFTVGMDGNIPLPGYIIGVADETLAGRPLGGRISAVSGRNITLDRESSAAVGERLIVNLPSGKSQARTIQAVNGRIVTVTTAYSETPVAECVWAVDASDLAIQLFRVTGVTENEDGVSFDITAIEHDPNKYARIDTGARIEDRPITVIPPGVQSPPKNVTISSFSTINQNIAITTLRVTWDPAESAIAYEAEWRRDNGNWIPAARTSSQGFEVPGIYAGRYQARVRAVNAAEISSVWANAPETVLKGKEGKPPVPVGFRASPLLWGIQLDWGFPDGAEDTLKTEIQYADNAAGNNAMLLADIPYPLHTHTMTGLKAGQEFWFRARLQDRTGNTGDWTGWIKGQSNANADDYLESIGDGFLTDKDGDRLTGDIDTNIEAILQNALANNATVEHQWVQYGAVHADILIVKTTIAEVDRALAEMSTQVQAQIDDVTAVLEDKLTATVDADGATAIHTLKAGVRVNGVFYNAGMSIAVLAETGKPVITRIGFNANQFVLMSGSGDKQYSPFAVINGQVFISDAFIQNASITSAKIADAAITNAKISGFIQSDNFSATNGWRLDKSGAGAGQIQINGGDGGGRMEIRGDQINVYDAGGNLRVRMGKL